ncbi:MAG: heme exporter protein CcmD [SAR116 cluster bacterium MED-G04]|nr:MAG: heme exporter protein CcmD [SAR116 cluster bacterium MED-G04]
MLEFFAMGGYAAYVWPSWLIGGALILIVSLESRRRLKSAERKLAQLSAPDAASRGAGTGRDSQDAR